MGRKKLQSSEDSEGGDNQAHVAAIRVMKVKVHEDGKLIKKLFKLDPLDWARYPDGSLVYIAPNGTKARFTKEELEELSSSSKPAPAEESQPAGSEIPADYPQEPE